MDEKEHQEQNGPRTVKQSEPDAFSRFTRDFMSEEIRSFFRKVPPDLLPVADDSPRSRIVEAAREVFAESGYDAATTRDIADRAHVNQAMIHYYFGSKQQLYRRTLITQMYLLFGAIAPKLKADSSPAEFVINMPLMMIDTFREHPVWMRFMRRELSSGGAGLQEMIQEMDQLGPRGFRELFRPFYERGVRNGELRDFDFDSVFQFVLSIAYTVLIVDPLFKLATNQSILDDDTWETRRPVWETILRHGIMRQEEN